MGYCARRPPTVDSVKRSIPLWFSLPVVVLGGLFILGAFALASTYVYLAPSLPNAETMHKVELSVPLRVYLLSNLADRRAAPHPGHL